MPEKDEEEGGNTCSEVRVEDAVKVVSLFSSILSS
jgi:hypothetical protein